MFRQHRTICLQYCSVERLRELCDRSALTTVNVVHNHQTSNLCVVCVLDILHLYCKERVLSLTELAARDCLGDVTMRWRDVDEHERLGIPTKRVAEELS